MNTKIVSKELIKPCTPTPPNLKSYKLSFIDEFTPRLQVGVLLFYASSSSSKNRRILKESLAKTLVKFYPLAGRYLRKDRSVDCSDQGAEFVEAEAADVELNDVVLESNLEKLNGFVPLKNYEEDRAVEPVLSVRVTELKCGGAIIGVSVSHRVFDASSLGTFIAAWSQASHSSLHVEEGMITINPNFDSRMLFPGKSRIADVEWLDPRVPKPIVKRFSFDKEAISSLRSDLLPNDGKKGISRVQVVCAVIAKAFFNVDRAKNGGESRPSLVSQVVNMRERTIPPLPKHACGNLFILSYMAVPETEETGIQELVSLSVNSIDKSISECERMLYVGEDGWDDILNKPKADAIEKLRHGEANVVWFSDWSKFGFYEADFGWGKPVWASIVALPIIRLAVLMDNKEGDGIEAWVHLDNVDMSLFEGDEGIKLFTT